jgi:hypothetical protein
LETIFLGIKGIAHHSFITRITPVLHTGASLRSCGKDIVEPKCDRSICHHIFRNSTLAMDKNNSIFAYVARCEVNKHFHFISWSIGWENINGERSWDAKGLQSLEEEFVHNIILERANHQYIAEVILLPQLVPVS